MPYQILKSEVTFHIFVFLNGLKIKYYKKLKLGRRSEEAREDEKWTGSASYKGIIAQAVNVPLYGDQGFL